MPTFSSRPHSPSSDLLTTVSSRARRRPFIFFGLPFLGVVVVASFGLEALTRTRYDLHESQVQTITKEDELRMSKGRKKVDIRDEYYRLQAIPSSSNTEEWDNVRVPRPAGVPEWGVPIAEPAPAASRSATENEERLV